MWITSVTLNNGDPVDLENALASLTINHGRADAFSGPNASTAQLSIRGMKRAGTFLFRVGVPLEVRAGDPGDDFARFTGTLTDAALDDDVLTVIAAGAALDARPLLDRRRRLAGRGMVVARHPRLYRGRPPGLADSPRRPSFDPTLVARVATDTPLEPMTLLDFLNATSISTSAPPSSTRRTAACSSRLSARATCSAPILPALDLDPADVLYSPTWSQTNELENVHDRHLCRRLLGHAPRRNLDRALWRVSRSRPTRISSFRPTRTRDAAQRLARLAYPRWWMPAAPLIAPYRLAVGQGLNLS